MSAISIGNGLVFPGWAGPAVIAGIAAVATKICARLPNLPAIKSMGYAEYTVADARYCCRISGIYDDVEAAPLLCAGLIGYRALKMAENADRVGIYGFGAAAHIVAQILRYQGRKLFAFTRPRWCSGKVFCK